VNHVTALVADVKNNYYATRREDQVHEEEQEEKGCSKKEN